MDADDDGFDLEDMIWQEQREQEEMEDQPHEQDEMAMVAQNLAQAEYESMHPEMWEDLQPEGDQESLQVVEVMEVAPMTPVPASSTDGPPPVLPALPSTPPREPSMHTPPSSGSQAQSSSSSSSTGRVKRRLHSKSGEGERQREALQGIALRRTGCLERFANLGAKEKKAARSRVRTLLVRKQKLLLKGVNLRLCDGSVLGVRREEEIVQHKNKINKQLLYDMAMSGLQDNIIAGAAAERWFVEAGEATTARGSTTNQERARKEPEANFELKQNQVLLTYICEWKPLDADLAQLRGKSVKQVEVALRAVVALQAIWTETKETILRIKERFTLMGVCFAVELCTRTWLNEQILKVHLHVWLLQNYQRQRLYLDDVKLHNFKRPHLSFHGLDNRKGMAVYAPCFYCSVEKFGQIFVFSNKEPHVDFPVKPEWVARLYAGEKISFDTAAYHLARQVTNCTQYLKDLERSKDFLRERSEKIERLEIVKKIQGKENPWRVLPEVVEWLKTFDPADPLDRYQFLVLDGPSQMGKTRYVQSNLVDDPAEALILDCADAVIPQLKGVFDKQQHKLIMFDEAHADMIIRCKKLFQSPVNAVTYGSSPTNAFVHTAWVHSVKLVVGSNVWQSELNALTKEHAEWIQANSVYVRVDSPLYVQA